MSSAAAATTDDDATPPSAAAMKAVLDKFLASASPFHIVRSIPSKHPPPATTHPPTLAILDSSFNPPTRAHLALATTPFRPARTLHGSSRFYAPPTRLLLLFSVQNADKPAAPAPFATRLALLSLFAADVADALDTAAPAIDVCLTTRAFYADKSAAIDAGGDYAPGAAHVHVVGADTFERVLAPRYYADRGWAPPLRALDGFFARHGLSVTQRGGGGDGDEQGTHDDEDDDEGLRARLARGDLEHDGGRRAWASRVEVVPHAGGGAAGVSSTAVRKAAAGRDWAGVERMCTPRVAAYLREHDCYSSGGGGGGAAG